MPNHTETILTISGPDMHRFMNDVKGKTNLVFDKIYPCEDENWYDWCCQHWGTKWDAYEVGDWEIGNHMASIHYQTAWSPATQFYLHISKQYDMTFKHEYADEGGYFLGFQTIEKGKVINDVKLGWKTPEGKALLQKLGVYEESEEEEEEEESEDN